MTKIEGVQYFAYNRETGKGGRKSKRKKHINFGQNIKSRLFFKEAMPDVCKNSNQIFSK